MNASAGRRRTHSRNKDLRDLLLRSHAPTFRTSRIRCATTPHRYCLFCLLLLVGLFPIILLRDNRPEMVRKCFDNPSFRLDVSENFVVDFDFTALSTKTRKRKESRNHFGCGWSWARGRTVTPIMKVTAPSDPQPLQAEPAIVSIRLAGIEPPENLPGSGTASSCQHAETRIP